MKHTFKRLLSLAVALFLVISMIPMSALPVLAAEDASSEASDATVVYPEGWSVEYHCVCGNPGSKGNPCADGGHQMQTWQPWTVEGVAPFRAGYWYLSADITSTNSNQFKYGSNFATNTAVIGRDAVDGTSALLGQKVDVYIDLNGKTITGNSGHRIFRLENDYGHTLTICDTVGTGKVIAKSGSTNANAGMLIWTRNASTKVAIYGGTFDASAATIYSATGGANGAAIHNDGKATIDIYGGTIIGGTASAPASSQYARGGAIYNPTGGTLNIHGGTVKGGTANGANAQGGTIFNIGTLNIYGGTVENGTATGTAGAGQGGTIRNEKYMNVYGGTISGGTITATGAKQGANVSNVGTFKMYGGTITGGSAASGYGGAFFSTNGGTMEGGTIENGTASGGNGGCVYIYNGTFAMSGNATISGGKAATGGNISMNAKTTAVITMTGNATIKDGHAVKGGNVYLSAGSVLTMNGGTISGGLAAAEDGTISSSNFGANVFSYGTATVNGGTVTNAARTTKNAHRGASLYAGNGGKVVVTGGTVVAGIVTDLGGAIGTESGGTIEISGGVITAAAYADGTPITDPADVHISGRKNLAACAGAAVGSWGGTINISGGTIIGGGHGGAGGACLSIHGGTQATISGGLLTGGTGAGSALYGGTVSIYGSGSKLTMTGGTITGNISDVGAVNVRNSGAVEISGDAVISGNYTNAGIACNLNLGNVTATSGTYVQSQVIVGTMGSKASIGVTTTATDAFTTAAVTASDAAAFFSDEAGHYVSQNDDGTLSLVEGHLAHCVCGGSDTHSGCTHTALEGEWIAWNGKTAISASGNYYLTQDVTGDYQRWMGGAYNNTTPMTINLCLNGYSIDNTKNSNRALGVAANVTVNLMNCNHNQSVLTGGCPSNSGIAAFLYNSTSQLNMYDNVKIVAASGVEGKNGGAVYVPNGATFNMYGGELVGGYVTGNGGAVYVGTSAIFNLYDGKISGGNAAGGGNIYLSDGSKFTMYDGEIVGGTSRQVHGGNIYVRADVVATILGGTICDGVVTVPEDATGDPADKNGGNIAMVDQDNDELGALIIGGDAVIKDGTANRGGNIFVHTGSITIKDNAVIEGGTAYAIYSSNGTNPSVEINWGRTNTTDTNRTFLAISGNPQINNMTYNDWIDTTGLEADAKIGLLRTVTGKVSSDVLSDELAACFTSTKTSVKLINETDALYAHVLAHVAAVEATCHQTGHAEYWYCSRCDVVYADEAATQVTTVKNLTVEAEAPLTHVEAVEAGLHTPGCAEYWYCETCDAVFSDAAGAQLTNRKNLVIVAEHELAYTAAVEATCHQNGYGEYWYCSECDAYFTDANGQYLTNIKNLTVAAEPLTHVEAVEATCHQNGSAEYWYCATCDAVFADAAGTQLTNRMNLVIAAEVTLTHVEAVEVGCHQNGCAEYWYCELCDAVFADAAGTQLTNRKNLVIAAEPLTHVEAVEVGCHQNGCAEYWYCATCDAVFADAAGTVLTNRKNLVIAAEPLTYVEAKEATYNENGHYEYWYCQTCDAVFADAAGTQLTNRLNLTIPTLTGYAQIGDVKYGTLADAIAAAEDGAEITVLGDHSSLGAVINKSITVDFGGYAVEFTNGVGSGSLTSNGLQILKDNTVTLKNGKLSVAEESKALFYTLIQNYADLTLENMILDGTNLDKWSTHEDQVTNGDSYTLSVNNGNVSIIGATTIIANDEGSKAYAIDSCHYTGYEVAPVVSINTTGTIGALSIDGGAYAISGGTFTDPIEKEWCEVDFSPVENADGTYSIVRHDLTYVAAVEATCHQNGCAEYWYCADCEAVFADAEGRYLTNRMNLVIPAEVTLTHVEAVEATCHQNGCAEYWYCELCDAVFTDAAGRYLTNRMNLVVPAEVTLTHVEAVEATCHQNGCAEYWYCELCDAVFTDAAGRYLTNRMNLVIAATPLTYVAAVEATFEQNGHYEYWYCQTCEAVFADAAGTQLTNRLNLTIPALVAVAQIGDEKFETLAAAIEAAGTEAVEIDLIANITLDAGLTVAKGQNITLDLNGCTITGTDTATNANFNLFINKGALTVKDSGTDGAITLTAQNNRGYNKSSSVISNEGGVLTIEGGTIKHLGGNDMAYGIDNNSTLGATVVTVKGGTIESPYRAIRAFQNSKTQMNTINIEGGTIIGRAAIWAHQAGANSLGEINISGGVIDSYSNAVVVDIHSGSKTTVNITGGEFSNENVNGNLLLVWPFSDMSTVTSDNKTVLNISGGNFDCIGDGMLIGLLYGADANAAVAVSGGTFSEAIAEEYCAEGFVPVDNGDGTYGVTEKKVTNPEDQEGSLGEYVTFTAEGVGEGLTYQWQYSVNGGKGWINSTSATQGYNTNTLTVKVESKRDGFLYRCRITDAEGNKVYTEAATLTVRSNDTAVVVGPEDATVKLNQNAQFTVEVEGEGLTYQWQFSVNGGASWKDSTSATQGYNTNTLTVVGAEKRNGFLYRCVITDAEGVTCISGTAALTVQVTGVTSPEDQTAAAGTVVTFTASVDAEVASYRWVYSVNGGIGWHTSTFAGCDTASMDVVATAARDGFMYRCVITTVDGEVITTEAAELIVQ